MSRRPEILRSRPTLAIARQLSVTDEAIEWWQARLDASGFNLLGIDNFESARNKGRIIEASIGLIAVNRSVGYFDIPEEHSAFGLVQPADIAREFGKPVYLTHSPTEAQHDALRPYEVIGNDLRIISIQAPFPMIEEQALAEIGPSSAATD